MCVEELGGVLVLFSIYEGTKQGYVWNTFVSPDFPSVFLVIVCLITHDRTMSTQRINHGEIFGWCNWILTISIIRDRLDRCQGRQPFGTKGQPAFFNFTEWFPWVAYNDKTRDDVVRGAGNEMQDSTWSDNKGRELIAVKVLHTLLLNTTVVALKLLPLGSYALMPAPSPPFKTILELVL